jgi:hypothetical protein
MRASELRELLRAELSTRLQDAGWKLIEPEPMPEIRLAEFDRALDADFSGIASLYCQRLDDDGPPVCVIAVHVGIAYEPLRRLWPLLNGDLQPARRNCLRSAILAYDVIRDLDARGEVRAEEDENTEGEDRWQRTISDAPAAHAVAQELAGLILTRGVPCVERLADVDVLLAELEEDLGLIDWRVPALLAAARRFDEATEALSTFTELNASGRDTRYALQLRRWIESGGDPHLIPTGPD